MIWITCASQLLVPPPPSLCRIIESTLIYSFRINPYPTAFPYGNGMVLHFYQQQESSTTKTVHKVINKGLKAVYRDRRFASLQRTLFIYLINKYISLSDICLTVHH